MALVALAQMSKAVIVGAAVSSAHHEINVRPEKKNRNEVGGRSGFDKLEQGLDLKAFSIHILCNWLCGVKQLHGDGKRGKIG